MKALAANKEDVTVAQVMAQADSSKITKILEGKKDQSLDGRPQKQSMGVNAIWLMFKVYSPLSTNEQVYPDMIESILYTWDYCCSIHASNTTVYRASDSTCRGVCRKTANYWYRFKVGQVSWKQVPPPPPWPSLCAAA